MDEVEKRVLSQMRFKLIKEMVVTESFLSAFCQSNILDDSMSSILKSVKNYEQRASKLLELLPSRGPKAFVTLMEILEITNPWLSEKMKAALHDERNNDAKINLHPSMAKSASIEGFGETRLHIDPDIKERSAKYVRANLYHLMESEQRGVDKWLASELQRERRRQQFRAPHKIHRDPRDFHASKECQTETSFMDMREIFEEMATYLHGVDVVELIGDISFGLMQEQIRELLARTRKLDALFLNCLSKFDDSTKYSMTLPELIDKSVHQEKDLLSAEVDNKKAMHKLREENEGLKRHVRRLEEHVDKLIQRQSQSMRPQEIQLRQRQDVHFRYTMPAPADSGHFGVNRINRPSSNTAGGIIENGCQDIGENIRNDGFIYNADQESSRNHTTLHNSQTDHNNHENGKAASPSRVGETERRGGSMNTHDSNRKSRLDIPHHTSSKYGETYVNIAGQKIHKAEPVHYEDQSNFSIPNNWKNESILPAQTSNHSQHGQRSRKHSKERNVSEDNTKTDTNVPGNEPKTNVPGNEPSLKIRRHASEESLQKAFAQEESELVTTTPLADTPPNLPFSRRNSFDSNNSSHSTGSQYQKKQHPRHGGAVDTHTHVHRMISDKIRSSSLQRVGSRSESDKRIAPSRSSSTSESPTHFKSNSNRYRDSSPVYKANHTLRTSVDDIANSKSQTRINTKGSGSSAESIDKGFMSQHNIMFQQNQSNSSNAHHKTVPFSGQEPRRQQQQQQHYEYNNTADSHTQRRHVYRSNSSDRVYQSPQSKPSLTVVSPGSHSHGYLSDSEIVLTKSSLRGRTKRSDKTHARVRFITPADVKNISSPQRKVPVVRTPRVAHYQMDTASTAIRKYRIKE